MPPKKPPPLPRSLFVGDGPLSPSTARPPPSPSTVHPAFVTDAHHTDAPLDLANADAKVKPEVTGAVAVSIPAGTQGKATAPAPAPEGRKHVSASARVLGTDLDDSDLSPSPRGDGNDAAAGSQGSLPAHDLVIAATKPLSEANWDKVDDAVNRLDGGWETTEQREAQGKPVTNILVSGLLPPPLSEPSSALADQPQEYNEFCGRLAQLSLHADVMLKALPPLVDTRIAGPDKWWEDRKELERVVKMYMAPAIETFGTHRIVFGSQPALPPSDPAVVVPIAGEAWYALLRKCVAELGEEADAMTAIMGANARAVYGL